MNIALWIVQGLLAAAFGMAGIMKSTQPIEKLSAKMPWVSRYPAWVVRLVGISEFLGAVGLVVPWLTGIAPVLTPLAAAGLAVIMVLAAIHHLQHAEAKSVPFNLAFLLLAAFVAYGRF
jgi:uncharacterized membrane protein YphA (DoxX/SURF4 family)